MISVTLLSYSPMLGNGIVSRINYCNSFLVGLSKTRLDTLQSVLNTAARLIARLPRCSRTSSFIKERLHWLPISAHLEYKVLLLILKAQLGVALKYL